MDNILIVFCNFFSCFIISSILFQFMESRYKKNFQKKYIYLFIKTTIVLGISLINLLNISMLNLCVWCIVVGVSACFLYYEDIDKPLRRILECETLLLCMSVCEAFAAIIFQVVLQITGIVKINIIMLQCLEIIFSKIIVIFLYYLIIHRILQKQRLLYYKTQYSIYIIILVYNFTNMLEIIEALAYRKVSYLSVINIICILLVDLYFLHFINVANEKNYYKNQVKALEQQANLQYKYYQAQSKKHNQTLQILHDVKKHIKIFQNLYVDSQKDTADKYSDEIINMLTPLIPVKYTDNTIFNILLTDKEIIIKEKGIVLNMKIDNINLDFIEPVDITTIFGNLLDNAIEAAEQVKGIKSIFIKLGAHHQMTVIRIENSCGSVKWKNGSPISEKGKDRGIGLLNVRKSIEKYDGDLRLKQSKDKFIVELFLNS